jgi:glutathione synthase/RimK-type ligase-like ATP-grasp enzyme
LRRAHISKMVWARARKCVLVTKTCLLITEQFEPTADFILAELRRRELPAVRWNLDRFPFESVLTYRTGDGRYAGEIVSDGRKVALDDVGAVWCRGFRPSGFPAGMHDEERRFAQEEAQRALDALMTTLRVLWINHPQHHARANSKPAQLFIAHQVGLDVPQTVLTNDPDEVRAFLARAGGDTVFKAHSQNLNLEPGKALFTALLTEKEIARLDLIRASPGIFQKFVPKAYEVRTTVVGARVFSGKINSQASDETRVDWRHKPFDIEEEPITLPTDVEAKILALMRAFGLVYGAFDFIVTPDGRHVFLEVNPAGQYLWVEATTKLPITAAIVDLLADACSA